MSQFTLMHKFSGHKPNFHDAMKNDKALPLYEYFLESLAKEYG